MVSLRVIIMKGWTTWSSIFRLYCWFEILQRNTYELPRSMLPRVSKYHANCHRNTHQLWHQKTRSWRTRDICNICGVCPRGQGTDTKCWVYCSFTSQYCRWLRYDTAFLVVLTPQLQTSIPFDVIKLDQVWWQNHDLNWILHPKKHLKFFWGASFLGGGPPKIPTFSGSDSERLERGPQCSARRRNFQKPLHTIVVLRWGYNPTERNYISSQYPRCPMQKTQKTAVFAQLGVVFESRWRGIAVFGRRCNFTSGSPSPIAELK